MPPRARPWAEVATAVGSLTIVGRTAAAASRETRAASLAFYPAVGLAMGALAALGARAAAAIGPAPLAGAVGVLVLALVAGERSPWTLAAVGVKAAAASLLPAPARTAGLLLAPMLARWAIVVQCYGGAPADARDPAAALVGRARFREFGWASLTAFAVTLSLAEAVGLLVLVVAALVTVTVRVAAHRRAGGMTGRLLAATAELVETAVLLVLALLARAAVS